MTTAQKLALDAVRQVLAGRSLTPTLEALLEQHKDLAAAERGALWDLSHGTLRHLGLIEGVLARMLRKPLSEPGLRALLAVAVYQLAFTRAPAYAIVNEAVEACKTLGWPWAKGMVNALLRRVQRERESLFAAACADASARYSYPRWWIERIQHDYAQEGEAILQAGNRLPNMGLRINRRRWSMDACLAEFNAAGLDPRPLGDVGVTLDHIVPVVRLPGFDAGRISVQDIGAQRAASFLDLRDGQRVLDACAAPGGKAAHVLERADVDLLALDNDSVRIERMSRNLERLGLNATLKCEDATRVDAWWDGRAFDRVLADVPCTGSGVVRRHPDIKWLRRDGDVAKLVARAAVLLDALWRVLRPGGTLLFVTCSVFREENRAQIDDFVGRHADASIVPLPGADAEDLQLLPGASHDGFYYALLERRG